MKKLVFTLALAALPAMAFASGIDITWDDCIVGGAPNTAKTFNCTANANYNLHFQFKLPAPIANFVAITAYIDYQNQSNTPLSPFWRYEGGGCQLTPSVKGVAIFDDQGTASITAAACANVVDGGAYEDPWGGDGSAGGEAIVGYGIDFHRPGNGYMIALDSRPDAIPLLGAANYWTFRINFRTANRAACAGCTDPGVILWQRATLESNDNAPAVNLDNPDKLTNCVQINGGQVSLCGVVPTTKTTWGQLKSLYR